MTQSKSKPLSKSAQNRTARLLAVQTLYGVMHTGDEMREVAADAMSREDRLEIDGERLVPPDRFLLQKILIGVDAHKSDLMDMVRANMKTQKDVDTEVLLLSILLCGAYEILAHHDIETGIIINDYLDVAHGFYPDSQVKLINAVLDKLAKNLRA